MNRVRDYIRFAVGFSGFGYIVLWPLTAYDVGCVTLRLSPGLHLTGIMASACVLISLALRPVRRWRRSRAAVSDRVSSGALPPRPARPGPPPRRYVKPRSNFGLRGVPR